MLSRRKGVLALGIGFVGGGGMLLILAYGMLGQSVDSRSMIDVELAPGDSAELEANFVSGGFGDVYVRTESHSQLRLQVLQPDGSILHERVFETSFSQPIRPKTAGEYIATITNLGDQPAVIGAVITSSVAGPASTLSSIIHSVQLSIIGVILVAVGAIVLITLGVWYLLRSRKNGALKN